MPYRLSVVLMMLCCITPMASSSPQPDIVIILADDLGRRDVGFMGATEIKTPMLDKLASAGARLDSFYVQPVCSPTRAALMTGRYPMRYGLQVGVIRPWAQYGLPLEERLLPQALREAGYTTAMCGKWHLGSFEKTYWPTNRGFDHHYGHLFGAIDYFTHLRDGKLDWYRNGEPLAEDGYSTHLLARDAVSVIRRQPKDKPLLLYVAFNAVHAPHQAPAKYTRQYPDLKGVRRTYAGMVAAMDEAVGQIVSAVEESGRRQNTLFIFSSDNGGPQPGRVTDNGPLRAGKGTLYEGGVRVCAFATWDGRIKPGTAVAEPLHMVDLYPTLLKIAGAKLEQKLPIDGRDAWPTIAEGKPSPHEQILLNAEPTRGALRAGDWKLVTNAKGTELYHLRDDPSEKNNLATRQPQMTKEMLAQYELLAKQAVEPRHAGEQ